MFIILTALIITATSHAVDKDIDLRPSLTPVKHQGTRNTCSAFAAAALNEFLVFKKTGRAIDVSEEYIYWRGRKLTEESEYTKDAYKNIDGLPAFLAVRALDDGFVRENQWPYKAANTGSTPPVNLEVVPMTTRTIFIDRHKIKSFLYDKTTPVAFNVMWYSKLVDKAGNITRLPNKEEQKQCERNEKDCFGHVILLVGYIPSKKAFIFRNSWGETWGDKGYGTIPEEFITQHCEICSYLPNIDKYEPPAKEFIKTTSLGVSAEMSN